MIVITFFVCGGITWIFFQKTEKKERKKKTEIVRLLLRRCQAM